MTISLGGAIELPAADLVETLCTVISVEHPQDRRTETRVAQHVDCGKHQSPSDPAPPYLRKQVDRGKFADDGRIEVVVARGSDVCEADHVAVGLSGDQRAGARPVGFGDRSGPRGTPCARRRVDRDTRRATIPCKPPATSAREQSRRPTRRRQVHGEFPSRRHCLARDGHARGATPSDERLREHDEVEIFAFR